MNSLKVYPPSPSPPPTYSTFKTCKNENTESKFLLMHCFLINVLYILYRQLSSMIETKWKTKGEGRYVCRGIHAADQLLNDDCVKAFSIGLVLSFSSVPWDRCIEATSI